MDIHKPIHPIRNAAPLPIPTGPAPRPPVIITIIFIFYIPFTLFPRGLAPVIIITIIYIFITLLLYILGGPAS